MTHPTELSGSTLPTEHPTAAPPARRGTSGSAARDTQGPAAHRWNLFLIGLLVLFLELACIRWFAAHVVFLQFFTNIVLIACFLGMSAGCLCAKHKTDWLPRVPALAFASIALAILTNLAYTHWTSVAIDVGNQTSPQLVYFGTEFRNVDLAKLVVPMEAVAGVFFVLITLTFVGLGQVMGRAFDAYPDRVVAYTANILGSLVGIAAFALLSFAESPPIVWFTIAFALVAVFLHRAGQCSRARLLTLGAAAVLVVVAGVDFSGEQQTYWSPYYRVKYKPENRSISVNTIDHQQMVAFDEPGPSYSLAHLLWRDAGGRPFQDALIIGAGSGNDVAHALRHGVEHIDAVEIDPAIQRLGQRYHPDRPYDDPRVTVHLDDGRNFLRRTNQKYDLAVYALVDSLILHSSYSNIRLESYLFTQEALRDVKHVLKPDGVFVMYNYFRQGWIVHRIAGMIEAEFGRKPLVIALPYAERISPEDHQPRRLTMIIAGNTQPLERAFAAHGSFWINRHPANSLALNGFQINPDVGTRIAGPANGLDETPDVVDNHVHVALNEPAENESAEWLRIAPAKLTGAASIEPARDDWPFLYLRSRMIPWLNVRGMLVMGALALALLYVLAPGHKLGFDGRMFFLGAAFLLLETKAVVHLALLFGSTWLVNSLVFFAILVMILAGNLYVLKVPRVRLSRHYAALFVCLGLNCVIPLSIFLAGSVLWKYGASCLLVFLPIFFAAVIFAGSFRDSRRPDRDFAANIAGAVTGGLAEYGSMLLGFRYLLLVAIAFYALSAVFRRGSRAMAG